MKKGIFLLIGLFKVVYGFTQIPMYSIEKKFDIDGDSTDWETIKKSYYSPQKKNPISPNKNKYSFCFDKFNLYGIFIIEDKNLTDLAKDKSGSPRLTFNDSIELYFDTKNDSKTQMDANDFQIIIDFHGNKTVFKGGDKYQLKVEESKVPKDTITNIFVMDVKTALLNNGYLIEFGIPFASLGIHDSDRLKMKMDIGFNDSDFYLDIKSLAENDSIPFYRFENLAGKSDFGFPNDWQKVEFIYKKSKIPYQSWIWKAIIGILLLLIIYKIFKKNPSKSNSSIENLDENNQISESEFFIQTQSFIIQNLDKNITPSSLADEMAVSLRQLQRIFKEEKNITPNHFIMQVKMNEAVKLLRKPKVTIAEVAYELGFSDPAYFSKVFKKHFQKNPSDFIENKDLS